MRISYTYSNTCPTEKNSFSVNNAIGKKPDLNFLFEKDNHLGSVMVVLSDKKLGMDVSGSSVDAEYYQPQIISSNDFYSYQGLMPGRKFNENAYRYGANEGSEKDDEIYGSGNAYTAEYWEYDPRLGRRWNTDPISYPWQSPYAAFNNNPIVFNDPLGLEGKPKVSGPDDDCRAGDTDSKGRKYTGTYQGIGGGAISLPKNASVTLLKTAKNVEGYLIKAGQVESFKVNGETFNPSFGTVGGKKETQFFGYLNSEGETYAGTQDFGESIINSSKHWWNDYEGSNTNSTQDVWENWLNFYSWSQILRPSTASSAAYKPLLRLLYENEVRSLTGVAQRLATKGYSSEEIAVIVSRMRRWIGVRYKDMTDPKLLEKIFERNMKKYGDPWGPSIEYLRSKGYTWEQIIKKAAEPGGFDIFK